MSLSRSRSPEAGHRVPVRHRSLEEQLGLVSEIAQAAYGSRAAAEAGALDPAAAESVRAVLHDRAASWQLKAQAAAWLARDLRQAAAAVHEAAQAPNAWRGHKNQEPF